jgi:hypothetical protein
MPNSKIEELLAVENLVQINTRDSSDWEMESWQTVNPLSCVSFLLFNIYL